jgi:hypothetical protein
MNYWAFRTNKHLGWMFDSELEEGRLRQGWGWDQKQDLRNLQMDEGARRNLSMLRVKKGDVVVIPNLPSYGQITIAKATEDWETGYTFEVFKHEQKGINDYGHIFPAEKLFHINKNHDDVPAGIRQSLRNPSRFWSITHLGDALATLIDERPDLNKQPSNIESRLDTTIQNALSENFDSDKFKAEISDKINNQFQSHEWEYALVEMFSKLYPNYEVTREAGQKEKNHGTDILMKMSSPIGIEHQYGIAIQVKDYHGVVNTGGVEQLKKAPKYWLERGIKIVDSILLMTNANAESNIRLLEDLEEEGITPIFKNQLDDMMEAYGLKVAFDL